MARSLLALCGSLVAATLGAGAPSEAMIASRTVEPTRAAPARIAPSAPSAPVAPTPAPTPITEATRPAEPPLRIQLPRALVIAPHGCAGVKPTFDLLIHYHGAYTTTEPQLMKSGIDAVYMVKNLGNGSGPYESAFDSPNAFNEEVEAIRARVNQRCGGAERSVGRIALSGWSAGYGSILRILARPKDAARVDAVLLADGMHVGYEPRSRRIRSAAMAPFLQFASAASRGEKLMAVTHSAIVPPSYASTTETARYLVSTLNLAPSTERAVEPRAGMRQTSNDRRGNFHVLGYAGGDTRAHCDHLHAISQTLWSRLRDRWAQR